MKADHSFFVSAILTLLLCGFGLAQPIESDLPDYSSGAQVMTATPGTQGGAIGGVWNPAAWAAMRDMEAAFSWNDRNVTRKRIDNWGLYLGGQGVGFSMRRNNIPLPSGNAAGKEAIRVDDYSIAIGGGSRADYWGLAYGWSKGETEYLDRDNMLTLGNIYRPFSHLSVGNAASLGLRHGDARGISDIGVRPLGTHHLTLFADAAYGEKNTPTTMHWGVGAEIMPLAGLRVAAKMTKPDGFSQDKIYSISLGFTMDEFGFHVVPHYDRDSELMSTSYLVRLGELAPSFDVESFIDRGEERVVSMNMKGVLAYQKSRWLDDDKHTLLELLDAIEAAKNNQHVDGIAMNLSGFYGTREMLWEVREKLKEFKEAGKEVYIYFDRAGMSMYYFASVADYLWIDPMGMIAMPGMVAGRTFWKGFFDKIGLGVEEWRYFEYKSAFESFARREMSEKDREQRLALIQDFYDEWRQGITEERGVTADSLNLLVDSMGFIMAEEALAAGLVDEIGRWDDAVDYVAELSGNDAGFIEEDEATAERYVDQTWGELPKIAVVYAIGECDMDRGIRGRYTSRLLRKLAKNDAIDAVVLRVDSPGGDVLPSDLVAAEMKTVSEQKPMIVSQGGLAASGGYWISMNADRIFTSPFSITGSIGVIGGWLWNNGFSDKTGFTYDHVKIGAHAELGSGVTLPFLGVTIPDRPLDDFEHARVEKLIRSHYAEFVGRVAESRARDTTYVDSIAQGRVWTGKASLENGLTDEYGSLHDAIDYAKLQAGVKPKRKVEVVEYPRPSWFNFNRLFAPTSPISDLLGRFSGSEETPLGVPSAGSDYELSYLRRLSNSAGKPIIMVSPEDLPNEDER